MVSMRGKKVEVHREGKSGSERFGDKPRGTRPAQEARGPDTNVLSMLPRGWARKSNRIAAITGSGWNTNKQSGEEA